MHDILDLDTYPLDRPRSSQYAALVARCQADLAADGMYNLTGFMRAGALETAVSQIHPIMKAEAFEHRRSHNIYFRKSIDGLPEDHPALQQFETVNHTLCADQIRDSAVLQVYAYEPLVRFIADTMGKQHLWLMDDPLARVNVMAYRAGEALNWHFDRSEFTTTLLLQAPDDGGAFEYRTGLRSDEDPNYPGVADLLAGRDPRKKSLKLQAGTLNVFRGRNTAHRVSPVKGSRERMIAVFSYYERSGVVFTDEERLGFYGRVA